MGYGIIEQIGNRLQVCDQGVLRPRTDLLERRLVFVFDELTILLERHCPDVVAIEDIFVHANPRSALILGTARGVIMLAAAKSGVAISTYNPRQMKLALTGSGNASKQQIKKMITLLLGIGCVSEDAADALGLAICHAHHQPLHRSPLPGSLELLADVRRRRSPARRIILGKDYRDRTA